MEVLINSSFSPYTHLYGPRYLHRSLLHVHIHLPRCVPGSRVQSGWAFLNGSSPEPVLLSSILGGNSLSGMFLSMVFISRVRIFPCKTNWALTSIKSYVARAWHWHCYQLPSSLLEPCFAQYFSFVVRSFWCKAFSFVILNDGVHSSWCGRHYWTSSSWGDCPSFLGCPFLLAHQC